MSRHGYIQQYRRAPDGSLMTLLVNRDMLTDELLPALWRGQLVGYLPANYNGDKGRTHSPLAMIRGSDFIRTNTGWEIAESLSSRDVACIVDLVPIKEGKEAHAERLINALSFAVSAQERF